MGLFKKSNKSSKGEKVITKTAKQAKIEKQIQKELDKEKGTCPECGHYDVWNGMTESYIPLKGQCEYFECKKCSCQWEYLSRK